MSRKAEEFDQLVREVFAPCYPVIARQIMERTGISSGRCLDIGCGSGYLGLAFAEASSMEVCLLDNDPEMLAICKRHVRFRQLEDRVQVKPGDVHQIPLDSQSVQVAVSRGSIFFWADQARAFREIYRVLAPGGMACVGGGFGTPELKQQIDREMNLRDPGWQEHLHGKIGPGAPDKYPPLLALAGIEKYEIDHGPTGLWIVFGREQG